MATRRFPGSRLTPLQKAAAVIITLGSENASKIYKHLRDDEIERLSVEIAKFDHISPDEIREIVEDFYGLCITKKVISEGGLDYARDVLEKAFGPKQAQSYMERVTRSLQTRAFEFVRKADYKNLLAILQNEHPQTIALILSYARADQAAQVLAELPKERRIDVVERIANLDRANPEIIRLVEEVLAKKFENIIVDVVEIGGVNYMADIMNQVDRGTEKQVFDELYARDPKLADEIRKRMFVFEDIVYLDNLSIQTFLRAVDTKDLAIALKAANPEVVEVIFQNMSSRMQETIKSDIEYLHNVRLRDVEEAQQRIVSIIRNLEEEGALVISKGGKDDVFV
jgi:flagellar motor switch protein FliG